MHIIDDTLVEGLEQVTIVMSRATVAELVDEMVDYIKKETVVFIKDNDGMWDYILTCTYACDVMIAQL